MIDEPFPPGQPKCVARDRDHIKIAWEPPQKDGGNPVKAYDVERKEPKTNRWVKVNKEPVTVRYFKQNYTTSVKRFGKDIC